MNNMKKITIIMTLAIVATLFSSCRKEEDHKSFVGTWGVEKIEYFNVDFAGNPIASSLESYTYDPYDTNNGIHLVFKEDKTGEMRDSDIDSIGVGYDMETETFDHYIPCPDTVLVSKFTYSYDKDESTLYMTIRYTYPYDYKRVYEMKISDLTDNSFIYENAYGLDITERAYLKRISATPSKSASKPSGKRPHKPGSLLGGR